MHEELIGHKASLSLPCSVDPGRLLRSFIEELLEVGGLEPARPDELERDLDRALAALCRLEAPDDHVVATLHIHADGVEMRLRNAAEHESNEAGEHVVNVAVA